MKFLPPGKKDEEDCVRNVDYYDRIRDVVDHILERKDARESDIADLYMAEKEKDPKISRSRLGGRGRKRVTGGGRSSKSQKRVLDLSWKDSGRNFPKHASRVGPEYQATDIPSADIYESGPSESDEM
jgi:hypothetical protein